jgi:hypothetical protein
VFKRLYWPQQIVFMRTAAAKQKKYAQIENLISRIYTPVMRLYRFLATCEPFPATKKRCAIFARRIYFMTTQRKSLRN